MKFSEKYTTNWSDKDREYYEKNRVKELGSLYLSHGIPIDEPEKRMELMINSGMSQKVKLVLERDFQIDQNKGRLLVALEKVVKNRFF